MLLARGKEDQVPAFEGPADGRTRIVVEHVDYAARRIEERVLESAGYEVVGCGGPADLAGEVCPVTVGRDCPAIAAADVVVTSFRVESPSGAEIIRALRRRYPEVPLIVEAPPVAVTRYADVLEGCHVIYPLTTERLIAAVDDVRGVKRPAAVWPGACV